MDQPVPIVTDADVERVARRDFPADEVHGVLSALAAYGVKEWHREVPRVRLAILKLAGGSHRKLRGALATAVQDYRDVLTYAEYPGYGAEIYPDEKDETKRQRVIAADWRQYHDWLSAGAATKRAKGA